MNVRLSPSYRGHIGTFRGQGLVREMRARSAAANPGNQYHGLGACLIAGAFFLVLYLV